MTALYSFILGSRYLDFHGHLNDDRMIWYIRFATRISRANIVLVFVFLSDSYSLVNLSYELLQRKLEKKRSA